MRVTTEPGLKGLERPDGLEDLYREHALGLLRFALLLTGDRATAEDLVQEAFLGLHRRWHAVREQDRVLGYLRTAVVNGSWSLHRRRLVARGFRAEPGAPAWSAEDEVLASEGRRAVFAAVSRLPHRQREVLALRYFLDLTEPEIASILGITRGTVASTSSRALAALGRDLREES
jgi:RNA polymerase sigma-70 factor (sigma-E family)